MSDETPRYFDDTAPLDGLYPTLVDGKLQLVNPVTGRGVTMSACRAVDEKTGHVLYQGVAPVKPVRYVPAPPVKKDDP